MVAFTKCKQPFFGYIYSNIYANQTPENNIANKYRPWF
jgi:hypothetical protein